MDGRQEAAFVIEDLPVTLGAEQAVKFIAHLELHVPGVGDEFELLLELGIGRPDLRGRLDVLLIGRHFPFESRVLGGTDPHVAGDFGGLDRLHGLGVVEIRRRLAHPSHQFFREGEVADFHGREQLEGIPRIGENFLLILEGNHLDRRHVFPDQEGVLQLPHGAVDLPFFDEEAKRLHGLVNFPNESVGRRVERGDRRIETDALAENLGDIAPVLEFQAPLAVVEKLRVHPGRDDDVLEAPLPEELHHQRLEFQLGLHLGKLHLRLVGDPLGLDFGDALHVAGDVAGFRGGLGGRIASVGGRLSISSPLVLGPDFLRSFAQGTGLREFVEIPIQFATPFFQGHVHLFHFPDRLAGQPDPVDGVGDAFAEARVLLESRRILQQGNRGWQVRFAVRGEFIQNAPHHRAVGFVLLAGGFRHVEVFLKAGPEDPVIGDIPGFAIKEKGFGLGIEKWHIVSDDLTIALRLLLVDDRRVVPASGRCPPLS